MLKENMIEVMKEETKSEIANYAEIGLDLFLKDGVLKDIPIVGSLFSVLKVGKTVKDYHFSKKIMAFIFELQTNKHDKDKYEQFINKMKSDDSYATKVTEVVIVTLDRLDKSYKARVFATILVAYINDLYDWDEFIYLSMVTEHLFVNDFTTLSILIKLNKGIKIDDFVVKSIKKDILRASIERLRNVGFISLSANTYEAVATYYKSKIEASAQGTRFYCNCLVQLSNGDDSEHSYI
jgi:hypothetical protein